MMVKVVNLRSGNRFDLYIGRRKGGAYNKWENPYLVNARRSRMQAIIEYERHLLSQLDAGEVTRKELADMHARGTVLGYFCAPKHCHGEVIALYTLAAAHSGWAVFLNDRTEFTSPHLFPGNPTYRTYEEWFHEFRGGHQGRG